MGAVEYINDRLRQLGRDTPSLGTKCYRVRSPQSDDKGGVPLPSIIWRQETANRAASLDGPANVTTIFFEIECRSAVFEYSSEGELGAGAMAKTVLEYLSPRLTHILSDYDEADDYSQERGNYVSHILVVGISNE